MLYRGVNKANRKKWIIADTDEEALEIAVKNGFVKSKDNCKLQLSDKYGDDFYESFKRRGIDMTQADLYKGVGFVIFPSTQPKGIWIVVSVDTKDKVIKDKAFERRERLNLQN